MNAARKARRTGLSMILGVAALGYVGTRGVLGTWSRSEQDFFGTEGRPTEGFEAAGVHVPLPAKYYRDDAFMAVFQADRGAVNELLPTDRLHPVALPGERTAVAVCAYDYHDTSFGLRYGEIAIAPLCTLDRDAPMGLPLLLEGRLPGFGAFVLHLPVTALPARDGGRVGWGYAKFVADMDFTRRPDYQSVHLAEGGRHILTLTVRQRGMTLRDNRPVVTFSVLDGALIKTTIPCRAVCQLGTGHASGSLDLGDHEIADQLRALGISTKPLVTKNYLAHSLILPRGSSLGPVERPYEGYRGYDRKFGRLTISYDPASEPVDVYASAPAVVPTP